MSKTKEKHSYKVKGINRNGLIDTVKVDAYSNIQAKWLTKYLHKFKFVETAVLAK